LKHRVLIRRCDEYDPARIAGLVREGMEELGVRPEGRVLLKPNVVLAHPQIFPHAFTRREFLEGVILAVKERAPDLEELAVGERSGITVPTRFCFRQAGYTDLLRRHRVRTHYFDEARQVPVSLEGRENLRDLIFVPEPVRRCDFLVNLPKLKAHPWTKLTLSLKNLIGLQDDRHRLIDHNSFLEHKIADLSQVVRPGFIAVDGIKAGQKMMLTPTPFNLGAVVMGLNPCAVDTVGCHMVGLAPADLIHLRLAAGRGLGPLNLDEIDVGGDFPLDEVRDKTRSFQFCLEHIDDYFNRDFNLHCTVGRFPESHSPDYCWGGCPGALQEAMHIILGFQPDVARKMGRVRYVVGRVEGPLDLEAGERVIFAGACTSWRGRIDGREVVIESSYRSPAQVDARRAGSNDLLLKMSAALWKCFRSGSLRYIHAPACPVSVADHVNYLSFLGGVSNPNFDRRLFLPLARSYLAMRLHRAANRFFG